MHAAAANPHERKEAEMEEEIQREMAFYQMRSLERRDWACRVFPVQCRLWPCRAAAAEWSVCPEKLLSHESRWRPQEEEAAAWRPLTGSDQSANTTTASRPVSTEIIPPWPAKVTDSIRFIFTKLNDLSVSQARLGLEKSNPNMAAWLMTFNSFWFNDCGLEEWNGQKPLVLSYISANAPFDSLLTLHKFTLFFPSACWM